MEKVRGVRGGTRSDSKHLCATCRDGVITRGAAESEETVYCRDIGKFLKTRVVECSSYDDKSKISLANYTKVAWVLESYPDEKRKYGFIKASEWHAANKHKQMVPDEYD